MAQTPGTERTSTQNDIRLAVADSSVVMLGIAVLGLGLGVILSAHHMPFWTAPLLSSLVFAGSVEFLMVGMISGGASIASIALTVFLVNARHLVYGLSYLCTGLGVSGRSFSPFTLSVMRRLLSTPALTAITVPVHASCG